MSQQIAVRMSDEDLAEMDCLVGSGRFGSRAELVRAALQILLRAEHQREADEATISGYTKYPQTEEEIAQGYRNLVASINEEPWEKWW